MNFRGLPARSMRSDNPCIISNNTPITDNLRLFSFRLFPGLFPLGYLDYAGDNPIIKVGFSKVGASYYLWIIFPLNLPSYAILFLLPHKGFSVKKHIGLFIFQSNKGFQKREPPYTPDGVAVFGFKVIPCV